MFRIKIVPGKSESDYPTGESPLTGTFPNWHIPTDISTDWHFLKLALASG